MTPQQVLAATLPPQKKQYIAVLFAMAVPLRVARPHVSGHSKLAIEAALIRLWKMRSAVRACPELDETGLRVLGFSAADLAREFRSIAWVRHELAECKRLDAACAAAEAAVSSLVIGDAGFHLPTAAEVRCHRWACSMARAFCVLSVVCTQQQRDILNLIDPGPDVGVVRIELIAALQVGSVVQVLVSGSDVLKGMGGVTE